MKHRPCNVLDRRRVFAAPPWLELSVETVRIPDGRIIDDFYRLEVPDFVVVHAETTEREVVVIRQYKHAVGGASLTLPGGQAGATEEPLAAARRELLEETGYRAGNWRHLGCGRGHFFKATGAERVGEPDSGDLEEMEVLLMDRAGLAGAMAAGEVVLLNHAAAIHMAMAAEHTASR